jgi:hypothetical protein
MDGVRPSPLRLTQSPSKLPLPRPLLLAALQHECKTEAQQTIHKQRPVTSASSAAADDDDDEDGGGGGGSRPKRAEVYDADRATFILQVRSSGGAEEVCGAEVWLTATPCPISRTD